MIAMRKFYAPNPSGAFTLSSQFTFSKTRASFFGDGSRRPVGGSRSMPAWRQFRALRFRVPILAGLIAVTAASVLVAALARRSAREQDQRTLLMARQVCDRTAITIVSRLRERFGAALFDSIETIQHTELKAYNLPRVDRFLQAGLHRHPYVTRFFFWHERLPARFSREVLFYRPAEESGPRDLPISDGNRALGSFFSDPARGAPSGARART
jgi:hypothetical protein